MRGKRENHYLHCLKNEQKTPYITGTVLLSVPVYLYGKSYLSLQLKPVTSTLCDYRATSFGSCLFEINP